MIIQSLHIIMPHKGKHSKGGGMRKMLSDTPEEAYEEAQDMGMDEVHSHRVNGELMFMPGPSHKKLKSEMSEAERVGDSDMAMEADGCGMGCEINSMMARAGAQDDVSDAREPVDGSDLSAVEDLELPIAEDNTDEGGLL